MEITSKPVTVLWHLMWMLEVQSFYNLGNIYIYILFTKCKGHKEEILFLGLLYIYQAQFIGRSIEKRQRGDIVSVWF